VLQAAVSRGVAIGATLQVPVRSSPGLALAETPPREPPCRGCNGRKNVGGITDPAGGLYSWGSAILVVDVRVTKAGRACASRADSSAVAVRAIGAAPVPERTRKPLGDGAAERGGLSQVMVRSKEGALLSQVVEALWQERKDG